MAGYTKKLNEQATDLLDGEQATYGVRAFLQGSNWYMGIAAGIGVFVAFMISNATGGRSSSILLGAIGAGAGVIVGYLAAKARFKSSPYISIGVTPSRVVVLERGFMGKVIGVLEEIPLSTVEDVTVGASNMMKPAKVEIRTSKGVSTYTAPSVDKPAGLKTAIDESR